jgi:glucosamine--fructose-6-phosphate aminotransferase (isomerizing)
MCGIIGIVRHEKNCVPDLIEGLKALEYRGYDSSGVAVVEAKSGLRRRRAKGKLVQLEQVLNLENIEGTTGIGHTRWATHGAPTETNAHPHVAGQVCVVHNGIIENYQELREGLLEKGHHFESETDTEVIAHLLDDYKQSGLSIAEAFQKTLAQLKGAYAVAVLLADSPDTLLCARQGSPLVIGRHTSDGYYIGSDALTLTGKTDEICYLENGDWAVLTPDGMQAYDEDNKPVERDFTKVTINPSVLTKGPYRHFMLKEIFEQPEAITRSLQHYIDFEFQQTRFKGLKMDTKDVSKITLVACGTSYYAAMVAKYWFESMVRIPVEVDIASEYRYRGAFQPKNGLSIFISQSGETADTLAALQHAKSAHQYTIALVNQETSTMAREADLALPLCAGTEIGVASTKAFTCQLAVLVMLSMHLAHSRGVLDDQAPLVSELLKLPALLQQALDLNDDIEALAKTLKDSTSTLYMGRGPLYPLALEGALKLKELSYIHAEGYAAGEMKHGPIALIDASLSTVFLLPNDPLFEKSFSNMQEILSREGRVIAVTDKAKKRELSKVVKELIIMPDSSSLIAPILYAIPMQLLSYHVAVHKGTDVDQPRNLAKSVTVE